MTHWVLADTAFSGSTSTDNLTYMIRRINLAYGWPNGNGTSRFGEIRTSTGSVLYLKITDANYTDLVSKSSGSIGLSSTEQSNAVTTAPTGDAAVSSTPIAIPIGIQPKVIYCIGDSITNGVVVAHTAAQKLHSQFVTGNFPSYNLSANPGRDFSFDRNLYNTFNYGIDSQQIGDPNSLGNENWIGDFPKFLQYISVAPNQKLIFHVFLGTNDLAHESGADPVTDVYANRLVPFLSTLKTTYPNCKIIFCKTLARASASTLNNRIISFVNAAIAGMSANGIDAITDTWSILGTGVWSTVNIFDPSNPGVTISRSSSSTVSNVNTSTGLITTSAANSCINGTPVNITSTGTMPTGISSSTAYYWEFASTTTGYLHTSLADVAGGTNRVIPSTSGSATISLATSGDTYYSTDGVHPKPPGTALIGAASKVWADAI